VSNWNYLDAYLSSIPASQKQQLLNTLYSNTRNGVLSSPGEYETRLANEMATLSTSIATPQNFKYRNQPPGSVTNSANYNDMENNAILDLKPLYIEAALLDQAISDHSEINPI
jgi:hypothetical protein